MWDIGDWIVSEVRDQAETCRERAKERKGNNMQRKHKDLQILKESQKNGINSPKGFRFWTGTGHEASSFDGGEEELSWTRNWYEVVGPNVKEQNFLDLEF